MQHYKSDLTQITQSLLGLNQTNQSLYNHSFNYPYHNYTYFKSPSYSSSDYFFIYDVVNSLKTYKERILDITSLTAYNDDNVTNDISAQFPLFFIHKDRIKIPNKVEYVIRKYISRPLLKEIHPDIDVAVEICLLFTSLLSSTYFGIIDGSNPEGWKSLKAKYLRKFLYLDLMTYKKVVTALQYPLSKGAVLECDYKSKEGYKNYFYRLGKPYIGKGIKNYELKTREAKNILNKYNSYKLNQAQNNPICKNLIVFYSDLTLPTIEEINKEASRLIKIGYVTKKGKRLTRLNKHSRNYFNTPENLSFVEDAIDIFSYLTNNGLLIPISGSEKSGGRVVDSFTLMPSWIRSLIKVKGKRNTECDYSCLHPNIAMSLYNGTKSNLTHDEIGLSLSLDTKLVKIEHLSFFNKKVWQMKKSPLFEYYQKNEFEMLTNIITEKFKSQYGHKITSRRLFAKEVEIMTRVIQQLNKENIYVGYIYDALFCLPDKAHRVKELMDTVIKDYGVQTTAKLSTDQKNIPITNKLTESILSLSTVELTSRLKMKIVSQNVQIDAKLINFSDRIKAIVLEKMENGQKLIFEKADIVFSPNDIVSDKVLKIYDALNPEANYVMQSYIMV
ncbi:hypothetical protein QQY79_04645 [Flavobacterium tructae]|uniref:hypothetical protein n=1 Tax=Flavobacterium tructae TaxID=1114873 RepID=UPI002551EE1F|nr:hypothetical protein [Flavobacterium tructae]MDL2141796.1 hypothetical protein [Flavobacterium tructae]